MRSFERDRLFRRMVFACMAALLAFAMPGLADWPQWRGPDGAGVAAGARSLPETWQPDGSNIRWRTSIRGEGISSPVASNGRVFLTTAYESAALSRLRTLCSILAVALAALFLYLFWRRRKRRRAAVRPVAPTGGLERWDARLVAAASFFFVVAGTAMAARPELFFPVGNPGRAWRVGGAIALLGLAAGFGWFARRSPMRLLGVLLVTLGAIGILLRMPPGSHGPTPLSKSLPFVVPGLALAILYLFGFRQARRSLAPAAIGRGSTALMGLCLVVLAALAFAPANLLSGLERVVVCVDEATGEVLWERTVLTSPPEKKWDNSTYATPTPATDGELVFAYFGHGLAALDFDGNVRWRETFPDYSHHTRYGAAASPVLHRDAVILGRERELDLGDSSWIGAWEKSTGRRIWWHLLPDAHDSYTTPMLVESESGDQLLTASWNALAAYDAASGERLWSVDYPMEQMVASMARSGDLLAVTGGAYGDRYLMVFRLAPDGARPKVLWQTNRTVAAIASPVFYDGKLFTVSVPGIMTVYDAESGEELWRKRLTGEHFASLVAGDGKVYATNVDGAVTVVSAADPGVVAVNDLDGPVYSSPAIAGGCLLIRTTRSLFCIEGDSQQARATAPRPAGGA